MLEHLGPSWYTCTYQGISRWVAMAKRTPFVTGDPIREPGEVWFEFGDTEEKAMEMLVKSIRAEEGQTATRGVTSK